MKTIKEIKQLMKEKNYIFFENGNYNLNIIALRKKRSKVSNKFDDTLYLIYKINDLEVMKTYPITTYPGLKEYLNPSNKNGVAILVANQYRSGYKLGLHQGKYEALVQNKQVKVTRDNNKDSINDPKNIFTGFFGINIHHSGIDSYQVDGWSAGCQVFKIRKDFDEFIEIIKLAIETYKNEFTYTLIEI